MESAEIGEMLDPLETKQIYGSNPTKYKKNGAIFCGDFRIWGGTQQNLARKHNGRLRNRDQRGSRYQDDVG